MGIPTEGVVLYGYLYSRGVVEETSILTQHALRRDCAGCGDASRAAPAQCARANGPTMVMNMGTNYHGATKGQGDCAAAPFSPQP